MSTRSIENTGIQCMSINCKYADFDNAINSVQNGPALRESLKTYAGSFLFFTGGDGNEITPQYSDIAIIDGEGNVCLANNLNVSYNSEQTEFLVYNQTTHTLCFNSKGSPVNIFPDSIFGVS